MRIRVLALLTFGTLALVACQSGPKISATDMKSLLSGNVGDFNRSVSSIEIEAARVFLAPGADAEFERLMSGFKEGRYNLLLTTEKPDIDYLAGKAKVKVDVFKGRSAKAADSFQRPVASPAGAQWHMWTFSAGAWQWTGFSER